MTACYDGGMREQRAAYAVHVFVCTNHRGEGGESSCSVRGSEAIRERLKEISKSMGISNRLRVCKAGCLGQCAAGPNVVVEPDHVWYSGVSMADVDAIVERHFKPLAASPSSAP